MLKRVFNILFLFVLIFIFVVSTFAQEISDFEKIDSFETNIEIKDDGTIIIVEQINYDFGSDLRHGIIRDINLFKTNQDDKRYILDFEVTSVVDEQGRAYKYSIKTDKSKGFLSIKIGDPDKKISGKNNYIISYKVSGAITYFSNHDELYWDSIGNEWAVPISDAISTIKLPQGILLEDANVLCFTGSYGSSDKSCSISKANDTISIQTTEVLNINEGLTVVIGFPKGHVAVLEPELYISFWDTWIGNILKFIIFGVLILVAVFWWIYYPIHIIYRWFRYGRDPKALIGQVSAWYDAPKTFKGRTLTPAETGSISDERVDLRDILSIIVDLAQRGYLKIEERKKKDFYFIKQKNFKNDKKLLSFEKEFLSGLFSDLKEVRLKDKKLYITISKVKKMIYDQLVIDNFFPKNPEKIRNFYILITFLAIITINIPLAIISIIFGRIMPRKTLDGVNAANISKSLKNFLGSQERQLEYQARNQMFFEKLLPYAVAFGVEKVWANRFKNIEMKEPDWYSGQSSFNSTNLIYGLNSSFKSVTVSATPTRSSSGFSSGTSSGGGFSGGGGGGGGGSSW